ncbi:hypothetical protein B488_02100 [Liberibacter crescens BT-1]|uniref:Uncharacterized protein n=1 Tax=Liberibacter crescens (strain BT-1) TaxID=1215343 RepID=L0EU67_LIBCB|nr:hypothetical protein B488_02100 [Liberibacter crescens BT-1]
MSFSYLIVGSLLLCSCGRKNDPPSPKEIIKEQSNQKKSIKDHSFILDPLL